MSNKTKKPLSIGCDDFEDVITNGYYYIDKSLMIKELLDAKAKVTLIPRPRRFGKTLNMTMLKCFFEKDDASIHWPLALSACEARVSKGAASTQHERSKRAHLFDGLAIAKYPKYMKHQGKSPVIFLTFKDVKETRWKPCFEKLKKMIASTFNHHNYLYESPALTAIEKKSFYSVLEGSASQVTYEDSIKDLSFYLAKHYGAKPVVLIDEYDTPVHAGFLYGYYDDIISFMRGFMCSGLKGNASLAFGVVTGIMRVARESIFSGMNNLKICSLLNNRYADKFGFTESEVKELLANYKLSKQFDDVRMWYNGYRVGLPEGKGAFIKLYNPWSILNFVDEKGVFAPYWVNTSDNKLVQDVVQKASGDVKKDFELILAGQLVNKTICEDIIFSSIYKDSNALWSFLVFTGYLTWQSRERRHIKCKASLIAPNQEVLDCLKTLINNWFVEVGGGEAYRGMLEAIAQGDVSAFERNFQLSVLDHMSFFDVTNKTPERVYHAYVLGWLVGLEGTHEVKSNRESGLGRYDVCIIPRDVKKPATIIEFKAFNPEEKKDIEQVAQEALEQIEKKKYETELRSRGLQHIVKLAIVFEGKKVLIVSA